MERYIMWHTWRGRGLEHLHLLQQQDDIVADGQILDVQEQRPFRVRYEIHCTLQRELRAVHVSLLSDALPSHHLLTNGAGNWTTEKGAKLSILQGCLDVDISVTPFTNTLPIRRVALQPDSTATLSMLYMVVPHMLLEVTQQSDTRA